MKENIFSINPYTVLGISQSASTAEITKAMAHAMKRKQFPIDIIAKSQKSLLNPQKRILADYLYPILPIIQRFKRQDYSELETPAPSLEFLPQFDQLEQAIEYSRSIAPSDEKLGQILFSRVNTTGSSISKSNTLDNGSLDSLDKYQFDPIEEPFNALDIPVLAPLESVSLDLSTLLTQSEDQDFITSQDTSNRFLKVLRITLSLIITLLVSSIVFLATKLGIVNSKNVTNSVPTSPSFVTHSNDSSSPPFASIYDNAILAVPSATPHHDLDLQVKPTPSPQPEEVVQKRSVYNFPANTCGDRDPGGTNTWYPVYVNYSEKNLSLVKDLYCRDAITKYRENLGLHSIQIASFLNRSDAQKFAELMQYEIGSGEVGEPNRPNVDAPVSVQSRQRSGYNFPADTCGDRNPGGANTWYPVYVNYSESNLSLVKNRYCHDALTKYRENVDLYSIQVASFLTLADAQKFAEIMRNEIGSGEVGRSYFLE